MEYTCVDVVPEGEYPDVDAVPGKEYSDDVVNHKSTPLTPTEMLYTSGTRYY